MAPDPSRSKATVVFSVRVRHASDEIPRWRRHAGAHRLMEMVAAQLEVQHCVNVAAGIRDATRAARAAATLRPVPPPWSR